MVKIILTVLLLTFAASCKNHETNFGAVTSHYDSLHEMYRTLWYRSGNTDKAMYDSSKKYGELYFRSVGLEPNDFLKIDTTPYESH